LPRVENGTSNRFGTLKSGSPPRFLRYPPPMSPPL
jgi:hypothetical protein